MDLIRNWFRRNFSDPQVVILAVLLVLGFVIVIFFGQILAPILAAIIIAYVLEGLVAQMEYYRLPRIPAFLLVFGIFMALLLFIVLGLLPAFYYQLAQLMEQVPEWARVAEKQLEALADDFDAIDEAQVNQLISALREEAVNLGRQVISYSIESAHRLIIFLIYLILVPLMVFFFLKDKKLIVEWVKSFLPKNRSLAAQVWDEVDQQMGNYVRGKFWEIIIVWAVSHITFTLFGLPYSMLVSLFVGLSVLLPYVGATVMLIPVALLGYFEWGWGSELFWVVLAYTIIQVLDGNLLAPLLLSEATDLHPIAAIVAIIFFGGLWGFWGVFFAIPLATLIQAVIHAWPTQSDPEMEDEQREQPAPGV